MLNAASGLEAWTAQFKRPTSEQNNVSCESDNSRLLFTWCKIGEVDIAIFLKVH